MNLGAHKRTLIVLAIVCTVLVLGAAWYILFVATSQDATAPVEAPVEAPANMLFDQGFYMTPAPPQVTARPTAQPTQLLPATPTPTLRPLATSPGVGYWQNGSVQAYPQTEYAGSLASTAFVNRYTPPTLVSGVSGTLTGPTVLVRNPSQVYYPGYYPGFPAYYPGYPGYPGFRPSATATASSSASASVQVGGGGGGGSGKPSTQQQQQRAEPKMEFSTMTAGEQVPEWARRSENQANQREVAISNATGKRYDVVMYGDNTAKTLAGNKARAWTPAFGSTWNTAVLGGAGNGVEELTWRLVAGGEKPAKDPKFIVLQIGTNNLATSPATLLQRLEWLVMWLKTNAPTSRIILVGLLPAKPSVAGVLTMNQGYRELAASHGLAFLACAQQFQGSEAEQKQLASCIAGAVKK